MDAMPSSWPDKAVQPRSPTLGAPDLTTLWGLGSSRLSMTVDLIRRGFLGVGLGRSDGRAASRFSCPRDLGMGLRYSYDRHFRGVEISMLIDA